MRLLLVTITAELPRYYEYYDSLDRLILPKDTHKLPIHSSSPAKNRNVAIKTAIDMGYTHIFFTDDDHVYRPDTVMRLLAHDVDIVSGMYCMKFSPFPIIALDNPLDNNMSHFINMNAYKPFQLVSIPRVPAGCIMVKTSALVEMNNYLTSINMPEKWFTLGRIQADEWGDDLWFCDNAMLAGKKIYMDTGVQVGHITKAVLWPTWNGCNWDIQFKINEGYEAGKSMTSNTQGIDKIDQ